MMIPRWTPDYFMQDVDRTWERPPSEKSKKSGSVYSISQQSSASSIGNQRRGWDDFDNLNFEGISPMKNYNKKIKKPPVPKMTSGKKSNQKKY